MTETTKKRKVIIDTDVGCDDAVGILMAMRDPTIEIVAITTVFGNVPQPQATENVFTILRVFDRLDIPFYAGASDPLVVDIDIDRWPGHGTNGLGDASFHEGGEQHDHESYMKKVNAALGRGHAVQALIDYSSKYPGEIELIALGPLTNLALGVRMDPLFASRFRSLTVMGASTYAKGNASLAAEFNFYCDPESAHVALQHFAAPTRPVTLVTWEATERHSLTWAEFDALCEGHESHIAGDPETRHKLEASFLKKTHAKYEMIARPGYKEKMEAEAAEAKAHPTKRTKTSEGAVLTADQASALNELPSLPELSGAAALQDTAGATPSHLDEPPAEFVCCDGYAVAAALRPDCVSKSVRHYAEVVLQGTTETRGMLAIDWYDRKKSPSQVAKQVTIVTRFHRQKYLDMMTEIFQPNQKKADVDAAAANSRKRHAEQ